MRPIEPVDAVLLPSRDPFRFETFEGGTWSKWTGVSVAPGESQSMDWNTDAGNCVVPFRIIYKDIETEQYKVDWCKISNIRVHDDKVTAD